MLQTLIFPKGLPGASGVMGCDCMLLNEMATAPVSGCAALTELCPGLCVIFPCHTTTALAKRPAAWSDARSIDAGWLFLCVVLPCCRWSLRTVFRCLGAQLSCKQAGV
jgi:hypothetical protein